MASDNLDEIPPLRELLRDAPLPEWLVKMHEYYEKTGTYRPEDLYRLLGDPNKRVEARPDMTAEDLLQLFGIDKGTT